MDTTKDRLTGFYTEKFFKEGIEAEILRAQRYERSLTFVLFKFVIPEKYHMDMFFPVFKRIAKEILAHTRKVDIRLRMGDRVLLVLPETPEEGAKVAATKISNALSGVEFYHETYQEYFHLGIEYAIGVYPRDGKTKEDLLKVLSDNLEEIKGNIAEEVAHLEEKYGKVVEEKISTAVEETKLEKVVEEQAEKIVSEDKAAKMVEDRLEKLIGDKIEKIILAKLENVLDTKLGKMVEEKLMKLEEVKTE